LQRANLTAQRTNLTAQRTNLTLQITNLTSPITNLTLQITNLTSQITNLTPVIFCKIAQHTEGVLAVALESWRSINLSKNVKTIIEK
jgi:lipopolysaccharide export system protein LptC